MRYRAVVSMVFSVLTIAAPAEIAFGPWVEREAMVVGGQSIHSVRNTGQDDSIANTLAALPGVDLRAQGLPGGQCDLSIRGSSFSGAGISLSGLPLRNAQTEHFNGELPIAGGLLSTPSVYTGFDQATAAPGHLVGTADFELLPVAGGRNLSFGVSEKKGYWLNAIEQVRRTVKDGSVGFGAFGGILEANAVDFPDNAVRSKRGGGQIQWIGGSGGQWDLIAARQVKRFGARGYYGVTPDWGASEATEDTLVFSGWSKRDPDGGRARAAILYREQLDDYTLYWSLPGVFNNRHRLISCGGMVDGRWIVGENGMLDWRIDGSEDRIRSSALGDHKRAQTGVTIIPGLYWRRGLFQAGGRLDMFEESSNRLLPQMSVHWGIFDGIGVRFAYSESVRQPSYTELNYESPGSLGNDGLETQTAATTELLLEGNPGRGLVWRTGVFQQKSRNEVDWIREREESSRWEARNIGVVDTSGIEAGVQWRAANGNRIGAHYTGLVKDSDAHYYSSRYALDYPRHLVKFSGLIIVGTRCSLELVQNIRRQESNPLRESAQTSYGASLALHIIAFKNPRVQFSIAVNNVWDDDFEMFPGQPSVSPRRSSAGLSMDW